LIRRITVCISTKNRRHILHQTLWSLRNQTYPWWDCVVVDDSTDNFNEDSWEKDGFYENIFKEIRRNHRSKVLSSPRTGKIGASWQRGFLWSTENWNNPLFCRCDDDMWLEPTYFENLVKLFDDPEVGGVSGLCLTPGQDISYISRGDPRYEQWGKVESITNSPNIQWFRHESPEPFPVEFFHSTQILRTDCLKLIGGFDTALFDNYREENHVSWRVHVEGYKLLVNPLAEAWHLRSPSGGTRAGVNTWVDDARKFSLIKKTMKPGIHVSLSHGPGDLIMATTVIRELKRKYPNRELTIWHPFARDVFEGNPHVDYICKNAFDGQRTMRFEESIYGWAAKNNWTGHLVNAYCRMLGVPEPDNILPELFNVGVEVHPQQDRNYVVIVPQSNAKIYDFSDYSKTKCWDHRLWEELILWIKELYGCDVIHLCGEEVPETFEGAELVSNLPLREAFAWIKGARCLVSIDTMALHVASAVDTPAVVLWGRTDPGQYGYSKDNMVNLFRQCPRNKPCQGGGLYQQDRSHCPIPGHPCMAHTLDEVQYAIRSVIQ